MKILLAAGIFYPDVGGPAIHIMKIAERLVEEGYRPVVVAYGDDPENKKFSFEVRRISRKYPTILQWMFYSIRIFKEAINSKVIYTFDPTAAGLISCVTSKILFKPFLIRVGGDPIWEREAEMGRRVMPITVYYEKGLYKEDKPFLFQIIKWVLNGADRIVFYNQFWKDFYHTYYNIPSQKMVVVKSPVFKREDANPQLSEIPVILFAGRFVAYKNLPLVLRVFDLVRKKIGKGELVLIGKGPDKESLVKLANSLESKDHIEFIESLPQEKLFEKIKESAFSLGPALSEFNPNFILESLSFGKPVILSKGHGLSVDLPEEFLFDPLDQKDLEHKMESLSDVEQYRKAVEIVSHIDMNQTWEKVTDFHLDLIKSFL